MKQENFSELNEIARNYEEKSKFIHAMKVQVERPVTLAS